MAVLSSIENECHDNKQFLFWRTFMSIFLRKIIVPLNNLRFNCFSNRVIVAFHTNTWKMSDDSSDPPVKKAKLSPGPSSSKISSVSGLVKTLEDERKGVCASILDFDFKKKRVRVLSDAKEVREKCDGVVYWMSRDMRLQVRIKNLLNF